MTIRIAMWSGPRNISTAMMRSFGARADCSVTDEPFYGAFLKQTGFRQPMADAVIASMDCDWHSVRDAMNGAVPGGRAIWYQKHMPHHMLGPVSVTDFPNHRHALLIRSPDRVIASYAEKGVEVSLDLLGYARQVEYFEQIADMTGMAPAVVDSHDVLTDPAGVLSVLCGRLGLAWDPAMLHWEKGARDTDGLWEAHWYGRVKDSTGFGDPPGPAPRLSGPALSVYDACLPYYEKLSGYAIKALI